MQPDTLTLCLLVNSDDTRARYDTYRTERQPFADLAAEATTSPYPYSGPQRYTTAWSLKYEPCIGATAAEMEPVLRTMRRAERHLDKLTARYGPPSTFGGYVARLADALGIEIALRALTDSSGWLTDAEYADMSPADAGGWLDREHERWTAANPNPEPAP